MSEAQGLMGRADLQSGCSVPLQGTLGPRTRSLKHAFPMSHLSESAGTLQASGLPETVGSTVSSGMSLGRPHCHISKLGACL